MDPAREWAIGEPDQVDDDHQKRHDAHVATKPRTGGRAAVSFGLILGVPAALLSGVMAFVLSPEVGLFGAANRPVERVIGMALALATGPLLMAGLLYAGIRRRDPTLLVPAALVAVVVSSAVTISAT